MKQLILAVSVFWAALLPQESGATALSLIRETRTPFHELKFGDFGAWAKKFTKLAVEPKLMVEEIDFQRERLEKLGFVFNEPLQSTRLYGCEKLPSKNRRIEKEFCHFEYKIFSKRKAFPESEDKLAHSRYVSIVVHGTLMETRDFTPADEDKLEIGKITGVGVEWSAEVGGEESGKTSAGGD